MAAGPTLEELARRTGEPVERLREWQARGLLGGKPRALDALERARFVRLFLHRGIDLDAIGGWAERGGMDRLLVLAGPPPSEGDHSLAEAAARLGLDVALLERFWEAVGFAAGRVTPEELETLGTFKAALDAGFPEEAIVQLARVLGDAMRRIADAEVQLFHFYVRRDLRARGLSDDAIRAAGDQMRPLAEPTVLYFHRRALRDALAEAAVMELAEEAGLTREAATPGQVRLAVVFVDVAGFTTLAETMGDETAAQVLDRFSALVRGAVTRANGHLVKQIGDAFMLVFHDPRHAVGCALEIERLAEAEPRFPAVRTGIHCGPVLYREGDYVGTNVNVAARVAEAAARHEVMVTDAVRRETGSLPDVEFAPRGARRLRGVAEEVELFAARARDTAAHGRVVDPVCGMELGPADVAARLTVQRTEHAFCSQECLRRFVAGEGRDAGA